MAASWRSWGSRSRSPSSWFAPRPRSLSTTGSRPRCSARLLDRLRGTAQTVVLPRTPAQREEIEAKGGLIVPRHAIDAQSLIALSDLVISAGGTMNREAVALGTPVFTTFEGRLGAVDEGLLREGRLRRLGDPEEIRVEKRTSHGGERIRRDPGELATLLLSAREQ
ncbi:MAG: DUF354 domain-containing protein [Thermoleophilaceae bacterium]